jgi:hypothetical protein
LVRLSSVSGVPTDTCARKVQRGSTQSGTECISAKWDRCFLMRIGAEVAHLFHPQESVPDAVPFLVFYIRGEASHGLLEVTNRSLIHPMLHKVHGVGVQASNVRGSAHICRSSRHGNGQYRIID